MNKQYQNNSNIFEQSTNVVMTNEFKPQPPISPPVKPQVNQQPQVNQTADSNEKSPQVPTTQKVPRTVFSERVIGLGIIGMFYGTQFVAGLIGAIVAMISLGVTYAFDNFESPEVMGYIFRAAFAVEVIVIIGLGIFYRKAIYQKLFANRKDFAADLLKFIAKIIGYFIIYLLLTSIFNFSDAPMFPQFTDELGSNQEFLEQSLTSTGSLSLILSICIGAPLIEEYVFRYGVMKKLFFGVNKYVAAFIASLFFAFIHVGFGPMVQPLLFIFLMMSYMGQSLVFSFVYAYEDNLLYPIVLHFLGNVLATLLVII